ncbi:thrombospondin [Plantactinospora siamensis]|uniref:Thrombospondin n=1 Tax=Plantactinospora siamensis TaxID=555372 RepID=A0ABV6NXE0_9ACTN
MKLPSLSRRRGAEPARDVDGDGRADDLNADGRIDAADDRLADDRLSDGDRLADDGRLDGAHRADDTDRAGAPAPPVGTPAVAERTSEPTTYRSAAADEAGDADRRSDRERRAAERAATARAATARSARTNTGSYPTVTDRTADAERAPGSDQTTVVTDRNAGPNSTNERVAPADDPDQTVDNRGALRTRTGAAAGTAALADERTDPDLAGTAEPRRDVVVDRGPRPRASLLATLSLIFGVSAALFVLTGTLAGYGMVLGGVAALLGVAGLSATRRRHVAGTTEAMIGLVLGLGALVLGILAMTGQFGWPSTSGDWVPRFREWLDTQFADRF